MEAADAVAARAPEFVGRVVKRMATSWLLVLVFIIVLVAYLVKLILVNCFTGVWRKYNLRHHKLPTRTLMRNKSIVLGDDRNFLKSYRIERNPDYN
jgi:hypothetical protein